MIVIYTPKVTNRIKYSLDFVFQEYFGIEYNLTENLDFTIPSGNFHLNYSNQKLKNVFTVFQDDLLLQEDIRYQKIFISKEDSLPVFFQTTDHFDVKFDIFSCIFFLLSRYEEYLPHEQDNHGRYKSSNSILSNPIINFSPIVEFWLAFLKNKILQEQPNLIFKQHQFEYLPTFDIDNAFQFLGRNWSKKPPNIFSKSCRNVLLKKKKDTYDTFTFIYDELAKNNFNSVFFFLMNDDDKVNSNVSPLSDLLQKKIKETAKLNIEIGIHPSYFAAEKNLIVQEKELLEKATTAAITISRQHFLKINFPEYYRKLIALEIKTDYSLSYTDIVGLRAGYSRPFYYFDLERNERTSLLLQPSSFMDATFEYYQPEKINILEQEFLTFFNQLTKINGKLVPIFHNDLFAKDIYRNIFTFINNHITK